MEVFLYWYSIPRKELDWIKILVFNLTNQKKNSLDLNFEIAFPNIQEYEDSASSNLGFKFQH